MKTNHIKILLLILGTVFYNCCFWNAFVGINVLLFTVVMLPMIFAFSPLALFNRGAWVAAAGCLLSASMTVLFNSNASIVGVIVSFLLLSGFTMMPSSHFLPVALAAGIGNFFMGPLHQLRQLTNANISLPVRERVGKWWVLVIIPLAVVLVFFLIFYAANPDFARIAGNIIEKAWSMLVQFLQQFSWLHLFFLLLGFLIIAGFLFKTIFIKLYEWERNLPTSLNHHEDESKPLAILGLAQLADETKAGMLMLVLVNILILAVNIIDIKTQWFGFRFHEGMNLSQAVHEGTGLLIFSILLAMGILLYLFRGNQNFTDRSKQLKALAYGWMFQNAILCISVTIRNYHYIENFGLAYKRIGVVFFLALTVFGLISLCFKIANNKPTTYLFRLNSWATYLVLLLIACCNWDLVIAQYNLKYHYRFAVVKDDTAPTVDSGSSFERNKYVDHTDKYFLLSLSDKSLQAFIEHPEFLADSIYDNDSRQTVTVQKLYDQRVKDFLFRKRHEGFMSWNYAENLTYKALNQKYPQP